MRYSTEIERLRSLASSRKMEGDLAGALKVRQMLEGLHDENVVTSKDRVYNLTFIANLAVHLRELTEAERASRKAVALSLSLSEEMQATCLMLLACVLAESEQFEEAAVNAERAINLFESVFGAEHDFVVSRNKDLNRMRKRSLGGYLDL